MDKVQIGDATLYHGDCMDVLASFPECLRIDLLLTDPPFGVGNFTQITGGKRGRGENFGKNVEWNECGPPREWFDIVRRVCKNRIIW